MTHPTTIDSIDFGRLYRDHLAAADRTPKTAETWDGRAIDFGRKALLSRYADEFIRRMDLAGARTLLDVGCGPGTICLRLAPRMKHVVALDFSGRMLDQLRANARSLGCSNVETLQLAWESDWSAVPACDIVVASRSTLVADLADALTKLDEKANCRVYLTSLVGGRMLDPELAEVIGRDLPPMPDYIYVVNILHRMGIHPRLDYIESEGRLDCSAGFDEFRSRVAWAVGDLDEAETRRLRDWFERRPEPQRAIGPRRWAFISWEKPA